MSAAMAARTSGWVRTGPGIRSSMEASSPVGGGLVEDCTLCRERDSRNLAQKFSSDGLAEAVVVSAGHGEAPYAADHLVAVVVQEVRLLVQHRQRVHRDARGHAEVA